MRIDSRVIGLVLATLTSALVGAAEPEDAARESPYPWTRFLAEAFPEGLDPERSREPHTIRDPGPDTANYPNSPETLPRVASQTVVGGGCVWFPSDRLSMFGNWGAGTDKSGPATTFQLGFAGSF